MNPAIIIPTFHQAAADRDKSLAESIYDHPTPLDAPGTLERCLESLQKVQGLGQIIITVSHNEAVEKVKGIVDRFPQMHTLVISESEAAIVQQRLEQLGFGDTADKIGVHGYSAVRNLGLVISNILGFDSVVFLDDDEVVEDPEFLIKAMYGLGKLTRREIPILAKSGYYLNAKGSFLSMSQNKWYNHYWQQGSAFNNWITKAMSVRASRGRIMCAVVACPFTNKLICAYRSIRGSRAAKILITSSTCACMVQMCGSTISGIWCIFLRKNDTKDTGSVRISSVGSTNTTRSNSVSRKSICCRSSLRRLSPIQAPSLNVGWKSVSREPRFCVLWRVRPRGVSQGGACCYQRSDRICPKVLRPLFRVPTHLDADHGANRKR